MLGHAHLPALPPTCPSLAHPFRPCPRLLSLALVQEGKLAASEELGDLFKGASDWDTAQAIYQQAGASGKVVEALAAKGDFEQLVSWGAAHPAAGREVFGWSDHATCGRSMPEGQQTPQTKLTAARPMALLTVLSPLLHTCPAGAVHAVQRHGPRLPLPAAGGRLGC